MSLAGLGAFRITSTDSADSEWWEIGVVAETAKPLTVGGSYHPEKKPEPPPVEKPKARRLDFG